MVAQSSIPTFLVIAVTILAIYSVRSLLESTCLVDNSHRVIMKTLEVSQDALNMQTGMRGFLLTGDEKFLDAFGEGEKQIEKRFSELKKMSPSSELRKDLEDAEKVILAWKKDVADKSILLRREVGSAKDMNDMAGLVRKGLARQDLLRFRLSLESFIEDQQAALGAQQGVSTTEPGLEEVPGDRTSRNRKNMAVQQALQALLTAEELRRNQLYYVLSGRNEFRDSYQHTKKRLFARIEDLPW